MRSLTGRDWEEVLEQRALETETMQALGLDPWELNSELIFSNPNAGETKEGARCSLE